MSRTRQPDATLSTRRLEAFTDGVFAIAATLLVLDLTVNDLGRAKTDGALWVSLLDMWPAIVSFTLSFFLLCLLWTIHVRQFEHIVRLDSTMLVLNSMRLFGVVLVPFTTSIYNSFADLALGRVLLPVNFLWVLVFSYILWLHATQPGSVLVGGLSPDRTHRTRRDALSSVVLGIIVVALAPAIGSLAFLAFVFDPVLSRLLGGGSPRGRVAEPQTESQ
jgi:uncharacterized membrane protein